MTEKKLRREKTKDTPEADCGLYPKKHAIQAYFGYLRHPWTIYSKDNLEFSEFILESD